MSGEIWCFGSLKEQWETVKITWLFCLTWRTLGVQEGDWHYGYIYINMVGGTSRYGSVEANSC